MVRMSKKKKSAQNQEPVTAKDTSVSEVVSTYTPAAQVQTLSLKDAAQRYINGFKEHHWPAIRKYADSLGVGESATVDQCLEVFIGYGARLK